MTTTEKYLQTYETDFLTEGELDQFFDAAKAFYLNQGTSELDDEQYDARFEDSGLTQPQLFDLLGMVKSRNHNFGAEFRKVPKMMINDYKEINTDNDDDYFNFKYDGSSIAVFYKDGKVQGIISNSGILQTKKLIDHVPNKVDPRITKLYCEGVVDVVVYGDTARQFANGMVNSVHKQGEVDDYFKLICFDIEYEEGSDRIELMEGLHTSITDRFTVAESFNDVTIHPNLLTPIKAYVPELNITVFVDGVVRYNKDNNNQIYKLYSLSDPETVVEKINMIYQSHSDQYASKLLVTPVVIDGTDVKNIASSVNNIYNKGLGRGARVTVIKAGQTIPKEKLVIERSDDFQDLVCRCGYEFTRNDGVGNNFKCKNEECSERFKHMENDLNFKSIEDSKRFWQLLKLPSFSMNRINEGFDYEYALSKDNFDEFLMYLRGNMSLTGSQDKVLNLNARALFISYKSLINK